MPESFRISAKSPVGVEIQLYDGSLNVIARAVRELIAEGLEAGLYLLSFKGAGRAKSKYVRVGPESPDAQIEFEFSDLAAPIGNLEEEGESQPRGHVAEEPLAETEDDLNLREQLKAIYELLSEPSEKALRHLNRKKNSIIEGDLVISVRQPVGRSNADLLSQVQLESYRGSVMAGTQLVRGQKSREEVNRPWHSRVRNLRKVEGFETGQMRLNPGVYRLRTQVGDHGRVSEQIIPVFWQRRTLIFTEFRSVQHESSGRQRYGIDPSRTIIMTIPVTENYDPEGERVWAAAGLLSAISRNGVSSEQTRDLCDAALRAGCPCIALYGLVAFQLQRRVPAPDEEEVSIDQEAEFENYIEPLLCRALELPTPDAALLVGDELGDNYAKTWARVSPRVGAPPTMLASLWPLLLRTSTNEAGIAPRNGFIHEVSLEADAAGPWLTWTPSRFRQLDRDDHYLSKLAAAGRSISESWPRPIDNSITFDMFAVSDGSNEENEIEKLYEKLQADHEQIKDGIRQSISTIVNLLDEFTEAHANEGGDPSDKPDPLTGDELDEWLEEDDDFDDDVEKEPPPESAPPSDPESQTQQLKSLVERTLRAVFHLRFEQRLDAEHVSHEVVRELTVLTGRPPVALIGDLDATILALKNITNTDRLALH